jgi:uncharacterized membrane protein YhaH (DUF805 family)
VLKSLFRLWFGLTLPVDRRVYLASGVGLMAIRCMGDSLILLLIGGKATLSLLHPLVYIAPTLWTRGAIVTEMVGSEELASVAVAAMAVWAMPFIWIGVSMSFRRARDAGISPWLALLFFVPGVNLVFIAGLCALPSHPMKPVRIISSISDTGLFRGAMAAIAYAAIFGVIITAASVLVLHDYGVSLFVGGPFVMGAIGGWRINRAPYRGFLPGIVVGTMSSLVCCGMLVLFALEGIVCLAMVAPLAILLTLMGAVVGTSIAAIGRQANGSIPTMALMVPLLGLGEATVPPPLPVYENTSEIIIAAPPELVWPHVIGFSELPPPQDWLLNTGIATPLRAHIDGEGVGALRYCEFTTGPFVEPITQWDPPRRLGFDVIEQPDPMHEWSPYDIVYAPHLENTMRSQRGAFDLIALDDGRTLLRGTTWYTLDLSPGPYWRLWSDMVVHRIHMRVLRHVKNLSEASAAG